LRPCKEAKPPTQEGLLNLSINKTVKVSPCKVKEEAVSNKYNSVFMGNIPYDAADSELGKVLALAGPFE
jgi:hypothetical protein